MEIRFYIHIKYVVAAEFGLLLIFVIPISRDALYLKRYQAGEMLNMTSMYIATSFVRRSVRYILSRGRAPQHIESLLPLSSNNRECA